MGGTHHPQDFEDYKSSCSQSMVDESSLEVVELNVDAPPAEDGLVTIRYRWEDLHEHCDLQMQLVMRAMAEQRLRTH